MNTHFKKIAVLLLVVVLSGCNAVRHYKKTKDITADRAAKECLSPTVTYMVPPTSYGIEMRLMRHKDCMGIPDMLMMLWDGEKNELSETIVKAIMLMYIDSINMSDENHQLGRIFLKYDRLGDDGLHIKFYELVKVDPRDYE